MATNRKTGALPSPKHALAAARPHRPLVAQPPSWIMIPSILSYWHNDTEGVCVTSEEAFAKACNGVLISDAAVQTWASRHGVLDGAYLNEVLDWMAQAGFNQDRNVYNDGGKVAVDYTNAHTLCNAIYLAPVKIGVASTQLDAAATNHNGWVGTGFRQDQNLDHCTSLCGYGTISWLCSELKAPVPPHVDGNKPGYAMFTWKTIGVIDAESMVAITGEAWLRQPTTIIKGGNPPTPDPVYTPNPPEPDGPPFTLWEGPVQVGASTGYASLAGAQGAAAGLADHDAHTVTIKDNNGNVVEVVQPGGPVGTRTVTLAGFGAGADGTYKVAT